MPRAHGSRAPPRPHPGALSVSLCPPMSPSALGRHPRLPQTQGGGNRHCFGGPLVRSSHCPTCRRTRPGLSVSAALVSYPLGTLAWTSFHCISFPALFGMPGPPRAGALVWLVARATGEGRLQLRSNDGPWARPNDAHWQTGVRHVTNPRVAGRRRQEEQAGAQTPASYDGPLK